MVRRGAARILGLGLAALALPACGLFSDEPEPPCPRAAILGEAAKATLYREGVGRDPTDVTYEVAVISLVGACSYEISDGKVTVESELTIGFEAKRGPAGTEDSVTVPYFVAVVDPARRILAKQVFRPTLNFRQSGIRTGGVDEIEQIIPVAPGSFGADYQIFVGLQFGRDQFREQLERSTR
jgi:hypothetical protein